MEYSSSTVEREKVYRVVQERNLASFGNNTRWTPAFSKLVNQRVKARLKHVVWGELSEWTTWIVPSLHYLELMSSVGPIHFREIEWVDFDCAGSDLSIAACLALLRESKATLELIEPDIVRVFGYR